MLAASPTSTALLRSHPTMRRPLPAARAPSPSTSVRVLGMRDSRVLRAGLTAALPATFAVTGACGRRHRHQRRSACGARKTVAAQVVGAAEVVGTDASVFEELARGTERKYIMLSGKGGVGKTSLSASLAAKLAGAGHSVLVVSTDPAHSLGDSFDQDIGGGQPRQIEGTDLDLWAMEIDVEEAKAAFMSATESAEGQQKTSDFLSGMGLGMLAGPLKDLQLGDILTTAPPGLDEGVAIAKVVDFVDKEEYAKFSRIIFDTAPTGHTLRLLSLPDFLDSSLAKIIRLRKKLASASNAVKGLFGAAEDQDSMVQKLEAMQAKIQMVKTLFTNKEEMEFVIATIPTQLAVSESSRLLQSLRESDIPCKRIVVNQCIDDNTQETYLKMKLKDQQRSLAVIRSDPALANLTQLEAPFLDMEVRGVPALQYFGRVVWGDSIEDMAGGGGRKYFMLGGKGGVGKTSSAASLGVQLAAAGRPTLVVSTDPAHSLSDSLAQDVSGGKPVPVDGGDLPLWGMHVDLQAARQELRDLAVSPPMANMGHCEPPARSSPRGLALSCVCVRNRLPSQKDDGGEKLNEILSSLGMGGFAEQLKDLQLSQLLDTTPPGVDEAVAISKVVAFLKAEEYAKFECIVFDTAPTGHTLRMLSLPDFLDASVGKILRLRQKLKEAGDSVKGMFGFQAERDPAVDKLEQVKVRPLRPTPPCKLSEPELYCGSRRPLNPFNRHIVSMTPRCCLAAF
mmetsp:Transcript_28959/g.74310  ORF Transcript_28959/g.74310 Transcript_28959/m.74310 type:complete len:734 (+) Transcript_28959:541-2742(+)